MKMNNSQAEKYLIDNAHNNVIGYIWDLNGSIPYRFDECYVVHHVINGINYYMWRIDRKNTSVQSHYYYSYDQLNQCCLDCFNTLETMQND